jgi:hypothetical protein
MPPYIIAPTVNQTYSTVPVTWMVNQTSTGAQLTFIPETVSTGTTLIMYQVDYEQLQELMVEQAARRLEFETARVHEYESARARAEALLVLMLTPEQAACRVEHGWFEVLGSAGGRYRIRSGIAGNVRLLNGDNHETAALCAHPQGLPEADVHLAQLLALADDELAFRRVANVQTLAVPREVVLT